MEKVRQQQKSRIPVSINEKHSGHVHNKAFEMESEIYWLRIQCELKKSILKSANFSGQWPTLSQMVYSNQNLPVHRNCHLEAGSPVRKARSHL